MDLSGVDLVAVVEAGGVPLRKAAATDGGEYAGPCPFCGGRDRFRVWPDPRSGKPHFWCRACGRKGDAIAYLRDRDGLSFHEACERLGQDVPTLGALPRPVQPAPVVDDDPPSAAWQQAATAFVDYAVKALWAPSGVKALDYLRARGLRDEAIQAWRLGLNQRDDWRDPARWGLDGKKVWLPKGITIPCQVDGQAWYVKVRRPVPGDELANAIGESAASIGGKYMMIRGHKKALFGADTLAGHSIAVLTEGEFDAMLMHQEAGDLVGVATLGSADMPLSGRWLWALRDVGRLLVAYDGDAAGAKGAAGLAAMSARVRVVRPDGAKDLTAMHLAGGDLRSWVQQQIARHTPTVERSTTPIVPGDVVNWTSATGAVLVGHLTVLTCWEGQPSPFGPALRFCALQGPDGAELRAPADWLVSV